MPKIQISKTKITARYITLSSHDINSQTICDDRKKNKTIIEEPQEITEKIPNHDEKTERFNKPK